MQAQSHIMMQRHPAQGAIVWCYCQMFGDSLQIRNDVFLRENDTSRTSGAAGAELKQGYIVGLCSRKPIWRPKASQFVNGNRPPSEWQSLVQSAIIDYQRPI